MAMAFYLELGYQSGFLSELNKDEQWAILVDICHKVIDRYCYVFADYAYQFGFQKDQTEDFQNPVHFANLYLKNAIWIDEESKQISIRASGSENYRRAKEAVALSFCHLVLYECFKHGFHVNLTTS